MGDAVDGRAPRERRRWPTTPADASFERSVMLSQFLFGAVLLVLIYVVQLVEPEMLAEPIAIVGIVLAFGMSAVAVGVPWSRFPRPLVAVVPAVDILAVGLLRIAEPMSGVGLLWVFPTIWLASYFGIRGAAGAVISSTAFVVLSEMLSGGMPTDRRIPSLVLLPITLIFVSTSAIVAARRQAAQRRLLRAQAGQLERALDRTRRQEQLLAEVLNAVDFGVARLDRSGRGAVYNRAYRELYGIGAGRGDAVRDGTVFAADRVTPLAADEVPFARAARGEEFEDVVTWIPVEGERRLAAVAVTARPLLDEDGEHDGSLLVARDVTAELTAVRARDDLVASVSHELRTPMTAVLGYVELSLDHPGLPDAVRRNLQVMERNGERMLQLIAGILDAASAAAEGGEALELRKVSLAALVEASVESQRPSAGSAGVDLRVTAAEPVVARADRVRLGQVLDNVLSNAIKYNRVGGEVAVGVTGDDQTAWIVVRDTGIGISADELPRIFDRFFRSESVRKGSVHGSGLGLGIARQLVEAHGGRFSIDSVEGEGTTVIIALPIDGPGGRP